MSKKNNGFLGTMTDFGNNVINGIKSTVQSSPQSKERASNPNELNATAPTSNSGVTAGVTVKPTTSPTTGGNVNSTLDGLLGLAGAAAPLAISGGVAAAGLAVSGIGALISAGNYAEASIRLKKLMNEKPEYQRSEELQSLYDELKEYENNKPADYVNPYDDEMSALTDDIMNREAFSYDFSTDPTYQQYKDEYVRNGQLAMQNTVADASALTGGYASSYAVSAGSQAFQSYLNDLNSIVPELQENAYGRYVQEGQDMYNKMALLQQLDATEYGKWRDEVSDYYTKLEYMFNKAQTLSDDEWQQFLVDVENWQFETGMLQADKQNASANFLNYASLGLNSATNFANTANDSYWNAASLAEEQRQYDASMAEDRRQYDLSLAEGQRQNNAKSKKTSTKDSAEPSETKNTSVGSRVDKFKISVNNIANQQRGGDKTEFYNSIINKLDEWNKSGMLTDEEVWELYQFYKLGGYDTEL